MFFSSDTPAHSPAEDGNSKNKITITREDVLKSAARRFFEKYMLPGKDSGVRNVLLNSCKQMQRRNPEEFHKTVDSLPDDEAYYDFYQTDYRKRHEPLGETLARVAKPETHVQVSGVERSFITNPEDPKMVPYSRTKSGELIHLPVQSFQAKNNGLGVRSNLHLAGFPLNKTTKKKLS